MSDITACQYDGVEIGIEKVRPNGAESIGQWLDEYDLEMYCTMSEWIETEDAVERMVDDMPMTAGIGAEFVGILLHSGAVTTPRLSRTGCPGSAKRPSPLAFAR
ncbi:hypothetical protein [Halalkalicoccus salilacus]|uniref:hypothetical protein n=1 Tax=Halalkalicoccus sp. GCM10025704 TaxID=3252662 RepID=UPI003607D007